MTLSRKHFHRLARVAAGLLAVIAFLASAPAALAQSTYPNKPVRLIVGFPAGTGPDIVARLLGQKLSEAWGT
eukprot:gene47321-57966_t